MPTASIIPSLFNDRLLLGLKGTMSEAELHVLRARLNGGIRNKAARGELRRGLPVGFVWGDDDGEVRFTLTKPSHRHPQRLCPIRRDRLGPPRVALVSLGRAQIPAADASRRRDPMGRARATPLSTTCSPTPSMPAPTPMARTRQEIVLDAAGRRKKRMRHLPRAEWQVLIPEHHPGFIDWQTYEANQARLAATRDPDRTRRAAP